MGALVNILMYSVGSMLLGILFTILGIVLMFVLIRLWWKNSTFTPMSFLIGGILFFFLAFQSILLCGAVTIKSYCDDVEQAINLMVSEVPEDVQLTQEDSQAILDEISREWPLVGYYVGMADFRGHTSANIAEAMADELNSFMNRFIWRRIGWSLLMIVIGAVIVIKTISINRTSARKRERVSVDRRRVGTTRRQRVSRRR